MSDSEVTPTEIPISELKPWDVFMFKGDPEQRFLATCPLKTKEPRHPPEWFVKIPPKRLAEYLINIFGLSSKGYSFVMAIKCDAMGRPEDSESCTQQHIVNFAKDTIIRISHNPEAEQVFKDHISKQNALRIQADPVTGQGLG